MIRATLVWGAQPDVDLHVFEPGGTHVYYAAQRGVYGELDVDDVTSFGPENYVVPCDAAVPGTWRIGVNYYRGDGPETATVSLFLGNDQAVSPRSIVLPAERGSGGNASPSILFEVTLDRDADTGLYTYTVN